MDELEAFASSWNGGRLSHILERSESQEDEAPDPTTNSRESLR
jgi:hypothetical protein